MANRLRELLQAGVISPDDLTPAEIAELSGEMPRPNYDIAPMQQNTMRFENGPDAGKVVDLDFRKPQQQPAMSWEAMRAGLGMQGAQPQAQSRQMRVVGSGNGTTVDLSSEEAPGEIALDRTRAPIDVPGVGKAFYSKDGRGAYVLGPDGRPSTKVILGYDMQGSMNLNKWFQDARAKEAQIAHEQAATAEIGAPKYQLTPEGDVFNPKTGKVETAGAQSGQTQRAMQKAAYNQGLKETAQDDKETESFPALEQDLQRFKELNAKVMSGRISGMGPVNWMLSLSNPERQEMEKIQARLSMNNFKPGQGSMSNFERTLIQKGGPNLTNDPETNDDIVNAQLGIMQAARDRAAFRQAYLQSHGNLVGAEQQWQQYRQANPAVVPDEKGRVVPNANRQSWMDYFAGGGSNAPARPMDVQRPGTAPAGPSKGNALPMPPSKSALIPGQVYQTGRGPARWNGTAFEQ